MAISVEEALTYIYENTPTVSKMILPIEDALGFIIAQDVVASHNLPPYDNSAMDGYAVKLCDANKVVKVKETIFAGDDKDVELEDGCAIKIMTGAKIPKETQAIVPQENTSTCKDGIQLPELKQNQHIRFMGEDIKSGELLIEDGEKLTAYKITILASQGISHIKVYKKTKVALFSSGNELKMHFENVQKHQLYNTNSPMLLSRAKELGCDVEFIGTAQDTLESLKEHIQSALDADLVITSGGVSVGEADFTKEAFASFGVKNFFEKIDIKPGKPTTCGKVDNKMVLNLPGNPSAAAMNFEIFAKAIILKLSGATKKYIQPISAKMLNAYKVKSGRRSLVPVCFDGEFVKTCDKFAPGMVSHLSKANAIMMIDEKANFFEKNQKVKIIPTEILLTSEEKIDLINY